jgi:hypothetical protein
MTETDQLTKMFNNVQSTNTSSTSTPDNINPTNMPESTASSSAATEPFRFLDLPVDIRTMVYEQLISDTVDEMLVHTQEREFTIILDELEPEDVEKTTADFNKALHDRVAKGKKKCPTIFNVCKLIRSEAMPIYEKESERFLYAPDPHSRHVDHVFGMGFRMVFQEKGCERVYRT